MNEEVLQLFRDMSWPVGYGFGLWFCLTIAMIFTAPVITAVAMFFWLSVILIGVGVYAALQVWAIVAPQDELTEAIKKFR